MWFNHVLVPIDFSEEARRPLPHVGRLGTQITLLHVVPQLEIAATGAAFAPPVSSPSVAQEVEDARVRLKDWAASLPDGLAAQTEVITGTQVSEAILDWAREHDVDLIALSTHGRTGVRRWVLGSVAEDVVRRSTIPVLSYPSAE